jgi:hypothetical protein
MVFSLTSGGGRFGHAQLLEHDTEGAELGETKLEQVCAKKAVKASAHELTKSGLPSMPSASETSMKSPAGEVVICTTQ